ncbi:MAG: polysaccharide biosynthesis protein [Lachnospiraceae bacterium]|nr:polysaccharide biosynthesis protein [Lachnospiraceae bacterium]
MNQQKKEKSNIVFNRLFIMVFFDVLFIMISSFMALYIRFEFKFTEIWPEFLDHYAHLLPVTIVSTVIIFFLFRLYSSVWEYASTDELIKIICATACSALVQLIVSYAFPLYMPRSYHVLYWFMLFGLTSLYRFGSRILKVLHSRGVTDSRSMKNIMLIGAGEAANAIIREVETSRYVNMKIRCMIDDDPARQGKFMRGIPIVGGREQIMDAAQQYNIDEIIFAIPSASAQTKKEILDICKESGCKIVTLPGMYQLINEDVSIAKLKDVEIEDLLGREPIKINVDEILGYVSGKVVLVTGGGGSIGSELCRQIASHNPKQLIIVDIYENNAYDIQQELIRNYPDLDLKVLIASVRNTARIESIMETYHPNIVYHAAAHKHVPLMEDSPREAIKNNVMGTYKTAMAADKNGVDKFVLISTDKAVNPTNVMGASKRLCEMVVQMMNEKSNTSFVAVRFGNVLGSNGSVIPLFKKQIEEGGPVTVTHPDIIRYFMTISEAVSLVLQAGAYAKGGEIFVLDMGEPVKILDLAENLIKLSGHRVGEDIEIKFTGLRPGEKMYEELLMNEEGLQKTANQMIYIGKPINFDKEQFMEQLKMLNETANDETSDIRAAIQAVVPTYHYENVEP